MNDKGKTVYLPRPVSDLRVWNGEKKAYDAMDPHLDGAPSEKDADKFWKDWLEELRMTRGSEFIDGLMAKKE